MRPAPERSMFSGSDSKVFGSMPVPIKSANAPELSKGKTTKTNIKVDNAAVFFTTRAPAV